MGMEKLLKMGRLDSAGGRRGSGLRMTLFQRNALALPPALLIMLQDRLLCGTTKQLLTAAANHTPHLSLRQKATQGANNEEDANQWLKI
jgi:hypothetical protein